MSASLSLFDALSERLGATMKARLSRENTRLLRAVSWRIFFFAVLHWLVYVAIVLGYVERLSIELSDANDRLGTFASAVLGFVQWLAVVSVTHFVLVRVAIRSNEERLDNLIETLRCIPFPLRLGGGEGSDSRAPSRLNASLYSQLFLHGYYALGGVVFGPALIGLSIDSGRFRFNWRVLFSLVLGYLITLFVLTLFRAFSAARVLLYWERTRAQFGLPIEPLHTGLA